MLRKIQFTAVSFGSLFAIGAIGPMREIYVLKFGADVSAMAAAGFVVAFWSAFCDPISGFLQDTFFSWYNWIAPQEKWGKRAPYMGISLLVLMLVAFAAYFPPDGAYVWWFIWVMMIATFSWSTINVSYTTSLYSLYKFKNERVIVEGYGYMMKSAGLLLGFMFFVITLSDASAGVRAIQALTCIGIFIASFVSIPVVMTARQDSDKLHISKSFFADIFELIRRNRAFMILCLVNAFDGCRGAMTVLIPYYLTYTSKESVNARSAYIVAMLVGVLVIKIAQIIPTQVAVGKYGSAVTHRLQSVNVVCQLIAGLSACVCLAFDDGGAALLAFILVREFFKTPHLFWILLGATWVVDEDVIETNSSREGLIIGALNMAYQLAAACFGAFAYLGLGLSGLDVADCTDYDEGTDEHDACYEQDQEDQPEAVSRYLRFLFIVAYPIFSILMAVAVHCFPIRGERLGKLEREKARLLKDASRNSNRSEPDVELKNVEASA
eukprot:g2654.t1